MKKIAILLSILGLASCISQHSPRTFQGEPLSGSDLNSVAHTIDAPGYPSVLLSAGRGEHSLGIFQAMTHQPYVTMLDSNGDGVFDLLTYSVLSKDGEILYEVEDYGMDGQADLKIDHINSIAKVFYEGTWHEAKFAGPNTVVVIDGGSVPLHELVNEIRRNIF